MKDKLTDKKILTPELWQHRIRVYEQERAEVTKVVINPAKEETWQDLLQQLRLNINGISLQFKEK